MTRYCVSRANSFATRYDIFLAVHSPSPTADTSASPIIFRGRPIGRVESHFAFLPIPLTHPPHAFRCAAPSLSDLRPGLSIFKKHPDRFQLYFYGIGFIPFFPDIKKPPVPIFSQGVLFFSCLVLGGQFNQCACLFFGMLFKEQRGSFPGVRAGTFEQLINELENQRRILNYFNILADGFNRVTFHEVVADGIQIGVMGCKENVGNPFFQVGAGEDDLSSSTRHLVGIDQPGCRRACQNTDQKHGQTGDLASCGNSSAIRRIPIYC